ncbi:MAG: hypothetical protein ABI608_05835 [Rhizomicrobium sp.]
MTVFALLAFFLQSLVVQSHFHPSLTPVTAKAFALHEQAPAPVKNQDPLDQCRLCQELAHAGSFFTPAVVILAASLSFTAATFAYRQASPDISATAFAWQSRAPPRR